MAKAKSIIAPFPPDIDRFRFGDYVSGFVDGEGSFTLGWHKKQRTGMVAFVVQQRQDDSPILRLIQSFFGCGAITYLKPNSSVKDAKPTTRFHVVGCRDIERL